MDCIYKAHLVALSDHQVGQAIDTYLTLNDGSQPAIATTVCTACGKATALPMPPPWTASIILILNRLPIHQVFVMHWDYQWSQSRCRVHLEGLELTEPGSIIGAEMLEYQQQLEVFTRAKGCDKGKSDHDACRCYT